MSAQKWIGDNYCIEIVHPKSMFVFWLDCHNMLATKNRLYYFGVIDNNKCNFCSHVKTIDHIFFTCSSLRVIGKKVFDWIQINHSRLNGVRNSNGLLEITKTKVEKFIRSASIETIYYVYKYINYRCYRNNVNNTTYEV